MSETIESMIIELPTNVLLRIGGLVCPADSAVKFINNSAEPQYYHNKKTLRDAIMKAWQTGNPIQKQQIINIMKAAGYTYHHYNQ
jgi:hypothetical protein